MNYRFSFINNVRAKDSFLSQLNLVERGVASMPIQHIKQCNLEALLIAIVV
jgi:hypothetical protein